MTRRLVTSLVLAVVLCSIAFSSSAIVRPGIEVLRDRGFDILKGKRVGLITNPTGVTSDLESTVDVLFNAPDVKLVALYGPEHGVRGDADAGAKIDSYTDARTGLTVYSLYGKTRKPTKEMLAGIDVLVYDIHFHHGSCDGGGRGKQYSLRRSGPAESVDGNARGRSDARAAV
jgi:uncharacterized protein YbbC (DUF1343 family)